MSFRGGIPEAFGGTRTWNPASLLMDRCSSEVGAVCGFLSAAIGRQPGASEPGPSLPLSPIMGCFKTNAAWTFHRVLEGNPAYGVFSSKTGLQEASQMSPLGVEQPITGPFPSEPKSGQIYFLVFPSPLLDTPVLWCELSPLADLLKASAFSIKPTTCCPFCSA